MRGCGTWDGGGSGGADWVSTCGAGCRGIITIALSIVISSPLAFISSSVSMSITSIFFCLPLPVRTLSTICSNSRKHTQSHIDTHNAMSLT